MGVASAVSRKRPGEGMKPLKFRPRRSRRRGLYHVSFGLPRGSSPARGPAGRARHTEPPAAKAERAPRTGVISVALALVAVIALALATTGVAGSARTERVSVSSSGEQGDSASGLPAISANGRYVAFPSDASNLVATDLHGHEDVF